MAVECKPDSVYLTFVQLRRLLAAFLVTIWAPLSFHCLLETFPAFEFLACVEMHSDQPASSDSDCGDDACLSVESGQFFNLEKKLVFGIDLPVVLPNFVGKPTEPKPLPSARTTSAPPVLLSTFWHFLYRTALPIRAPSFLS